MSVTFHVQWGNGCMASYDEVNVSNSNARALLNIIAPWYTDLVGVIEGDELETVYKNIVKALNLEHLRQGAVKETYVDQTPGCATIVCCGRDDTYVKERLSQLLSMVIIARQLKANLTFA